MATAPTTIVAYADDKGRYNHVVNAAVETAAQAEARLVLYDIDGPGLPRDLFPTEGLEIPDGDLLDSRHLEAAGRTQLASQVAQARDAGVDAYGWIPAEGGADALGRYSEMIGADMIMLPADLLAPSLMERLRGRSLAPLEDMSETPVAIIHRSGDVEMREPVSER